MAYSFGVSIGTGGDLHGRYEWVSLAPLAQRVERVTLVSLSWVRSPDGAPRHLLDATKQRITVSGNKTLPDMRQVLSQFTDAERMQQDADGLRRYKTCTAIHVHRDISMFITALGHDPIFIRAVCARFRTWHGGNGIEC